MQNTSAKDATELLLKQKTSAPQKNSNNLFSFLCLFNADSLFQTATIFLAHVFENFSYAFNSFFLFSGVLLSHGSTSVWVNFVVTFAKDLNRL
jgi:hypothetical protein